MDRGAPMCYTVHWVTKSLNFTKAEQLALSLSDLRWDPRICISNKFPGGIYTAYWDHMVENHSSVELLTIYCNKVVFRNIFQTRNTEKAPTFTLHKTFV